MAEGQYMPRTCAKCDGRIVEADFPPAVVAKRKGFPRAFNRRYSRLTAVTCLTCGFVEFFAVDPSQLAPDRN